MSDSNEQWQDPQERSDDTSSKANPAPAATAVQNGFLNLVNADSDYFLQTDDILASILPLFREVATIHGQGLVMPADGIASLTVKEGNVLTTAGSAKSPVSNLSKIENLQTQVSKALYVSQHREVTSDDNGDLSVANLDVVEADHDFTHPVYVTGYKTWEQALGHHDALSDILVLGQVLASLALGLDFTRIEDLTIFATNRSNLFAINARLHPVVAAVIVEMTELNRHRRATDLSSCIFRLEAYREQTVELDLSRIPGFQNAELVGRRKLLLEKLRERLFEISRRNKLLYFKPSQSALNLTVASVPLVLNITSIKIEHMFLWQKPLMEEILAGSTISLRKWLRFEDQLYLPSALDKLISDARRDRSEFGFAQLRLVVAFLQWHNLKEDKEERINSPLLLLPIELSKKKGVNDQYVMNVTSSEAEINPVLRHHLNQLYGLKLPEKIDLLQTSVGELHQLLQDQIHATEPGVTLRLLDKPEIALINEKARQRLGKFQKSLKNRFRLNRSKTSFDYCYNKQDFKPLGLQIYLDKVKPQSLPQRLAAGGTSQDRTPFAVPNSTADDSIETTRQTYSLNTDPQGNPYTWDFDLCSLTIGNFNYRKMSLVRDYSLILEDEIASETFDKVFSLDPKQISETQTKPSLDAKEDWTVAPGDATQTLALAFARSGSSCIIQGPPGTGKSQTITNLVADYVARGKKVLFVCEKRAAIDVVYHRLRQRGLDELCTLIHDSQADKKAFIQNLKQTYETWIDRADSLNETNHQRTNRLNARFQDLESIARFDQVMRDRPAHLSGDVRTLFARLVELREQIPTLSANEAETLPTLAEWDAHSHIAERITTILAEISNASVLAMHPYKWLGTGVIRAEQPLRTLNDLSRKAETLLEEIQTAYENAGLKRPDWSSLNRLLELTSLCEEVSPLASRDQLSLLDFDSSLSKELESLISSIKKLEKRRDQCRGKTANWRNKLSPEETSAALAHMRENEESPMRWLKPSWWKLKGLIESNYEFKRHTVKPKYSQILTELEAEHSAQQALDDAYCEAEQKFGDNPATVKKSIQELHSRSHSDVQKLQFLPLLQAASGSRIVSLALKHKFQVEELASTLNELLTNAGDCDLESLGEIIRDIVEESDSLTEMIPVLTELADAPDAFSKTLRTMNLTPKQLEAAVANASRERLYRAERWLHKFDGRLLEQRANRIAQTTKELLKDNASVIRDLTHRNFREKVRISSTSATQLDSQQKLLKKSYSTGRRELEHEFGKSVRYKSIRDIVAGDSGAVVSDLKPIWLMSPLSVSDTLPLSPDLFDVIIFDEASQITVEEAVPALYRAKQVIVVGDEMQLPPTKFFSTGKSSEEETLELEEDGERIMVSLDADSLLAQSSRNLPSTLLAWHYRSRYESLISFSNTAFYAGNLYTIPDRIRQGEAAEQILVRQSEDAIRYAGLLLNRPISFHLMERSPYQMRRNAGEANYIAHLVRELLTRETKLSIGIVAFSEAQQSEIESALATLAEKDRDFSVRLEQEYAREEDDQYCGLFIKNLENVQGDERDIIILSICYGPDENGRMVMNFGPVNQRGGEKRLNVIFSRARQHMAIVSSIKHSAITNDYNDGAAALKNFLHYAQSSSEGQPEVARSILDRLNPQTAAGRWRLTKDQVSSELADALRARGYFVGEKIGQSRFRCDIGIANPEENYFRVGIIVDSENHYLNPDVMERFVTQPEILRAFGWKVTIVLTRDWFYNRDQIVERIERMMNDETQVDAELEDAPNGELPSPVKTPEVKHRAVGTEQSAAAAIGVVPPRDDAFRRFELKEGNTMKFWEIALANNSVSVRFGKIGTSGQTRTTLFDSPERAAKECEKLVNEKLRKGFTEVTPR